MNEFSKQQFEAFFAAISAWRPAYRRARLHFLAVRNEDVLSIVAARIYLDMGGDEPIKPRMRAGDLEAAQWEIPQQETSIEEVLLALVAPEGLQIEELGRLMLVSDERHDVFIAPPTLLHPEGLNVGNRIAVLTLNGTNRSAWVPQPESDWQLKAADPPYDSVQELCFEYGLGFLKGENAQVEVVAQSTTQVLNRSAVVGTCATLGLWMGEGLDIAKARLGYRILDNGKAIRRGSIPGQEMDWKIEGPAHVGTIQLEVPIGAVVQCIASYDGHAQNVQWRADPSIHQNPRAAVLALVDPRQQLLRDYLQPELPPKGKTADDFEAAVGWLLWVLGFSTASFGTNAKTRDGFDTVAVTPNGDFVVVESTTGLLRADSKLSKLAARAAALRESLAASNMKHLRVLPIIVTALTAEQVKADVAQAEEVGILVLTKADLASMLDVDLLRYPDADRVFEQAIGVVVERTAARSRPVAPGISLG